MKRLSVAVFIIFFLLITVQNGSASVNISRSITLGSNDIFVTSFSATKGEKLKFDYNVTSGGAVDFIVLNETNFNFYVNGWIDKNISTFSYQGEFSAINTTHALLNATVGLSQTYYLVIENSNYFKGGAITIGPVSVTISINDTKTSPGFGFDTIGLFLVVSAAFMLFKKRKQSKLK